MVDRKEAIISIHGIHSRRIIAGTKTVELRRRFPEMAPGSRLWIYETMPTGAVVGFATVAGFDRGTPEALWRHHGRGTCVKLRDFMAYLEGCLEAVAITLEDARGVSPVVRSTLRTVRAGFHPPQVMTLLTPGEGLALRMAVTEEEPLPPHASARCKDLKQFSLPIMP